MYLAHLQEKNLKKFAELKLHLQICSHKYIDNIVIITTLLEGIENRLRVNKKLFQSIKLPKTLSLSAIFNHFDDANKRLFILFVSMVAIACMKRL